jgi:hypothetical protein
MELGMGMELAGQASDLLEKIRRGWQSAVEIVMESGVSREIGRQPEGNLWSKLEKARLCGSPVTAVTFA